MSASKWLAVPLSALLLGGSLMWTLPALADSGSDSSYNYDADQKPDNQVDQDQPTKDNSVTIHHTANNDPFQNEKIHWQNPHGTGNTGTPLQGAWSTNGTALPGSWSTSASMVHPVVPNLNAPAPLLNLPDQNSPFNAKLPTSTSLSKAARQKLKALRHAHGHYRYQYGTVNMRNLTGNPYYHYGSYRSDVPRLQSSIGYGTRSNGETWAPVEAP